MEDMLDFHSVIFISSDLEETLPLSAPAHTNSSAPHPSYLMYTTAALSSEQRTQLFSELHDDECPPDQIRLAPDNFQGANIRAVYEHHIYAREQDRSIHPWLFIVIDKPNWTKDGVLIVNLAVPTEQKDPSRVVGVARCGVDGDLGAESNCINLDIANCNWEDVKNIELPDWHGDDPSCNERYQHPSPDKGDASQATAYAWYSLIPRALVIDRALEPDVAGLDEDKRRLILRGTPRSFSQKPPIWDEIRRKHPWSCLSSNRIHRSLFLVGEKPETDEANSVAIYRALWDSDRALSGITWNESIPHPCVSEQDKAKLDAIRPEIELVEHLRASEALQRLDALAGYER